MDLEAVPGAEVAPVGLDLPAVALDVDPGVGPGHVGADEVVAADHPGGGPLLEVDALGGHLGADPVVEDPVAVAAVGLAAAVLAPVAVGAADVQTLAVPGLAQAGVVDQVAPDQVVGREGAQVDALVPDVVDVDALDDVVGRPVGHDALLAVGDAEAAEGPVVGPVQVEHVALLQGVAPQHRPARPAQRDPLAGRARAAQGELALVDAVGQADALALGGLVQGPLELLGVADVDGRAGLAVLALVAGGLRAASTPARADRRVLTLVPMVGTGAVAGPAAGAAAERGAPPGPSLTTRANDSATRPVTARAAAARAARPGRVGCSDIDPPDGRGLVPAPHPPAVPQAQGQGHGGHGQDQQPEQRRGVEPEEVAQLVGRGQ